MAFGSVAIEDSRRQETSMNVNDRTLSDCSEESCPTRGVLHLFRVS